MNQQDKLNQRFLSNYRSMVDVIAALTASTNKTVNIEIDPKRMEFMKANHYKLCFAKRVGEFDYNVVWESYDGEQYYHSNTFSYEPKYQIFGTKTYQHSVKVKTSTNVSTIGLGQTCTLSKGGTMSKAVDGGTKTALNLKNENSDIHVGVNQLSTDGEGNLVSTPIYVSEFFVVVGESSLTPKEQVLVWFEQDIETSTIFTTARSTAKEIELTFVNEASLRYTATGQWEEI